MLSGPRLQLQSLDTVCVCVHKAERIEPTLLWYKLTHWSEPHQPLQQKRKGKLEVLAVANHVLKPSGHLEQEGPPRIFSGIPFSLLNTMGYDWAWLCFLHDHIWSNSIMLNQESPERGEEWARRWEHLASYAPIISISSLRNKMTRRMHEGQVEGSRLV